MAKEIDSMDKINDTTLHELLLMMDARLKHIEDISADNRAIIVKLVKQSNQIVEFLKNLEIDIDEQYGIDAPPSFSNIIDINSSKTDELKELLEEVKSKKETYEGFWDKRIGNEKDWSDGMRQYINKWKKKNPGIEPDLTRSGEIYKEWERVSKKYAGSREDRTETKRVKDKYIQGTKGKTIKINQNQYQKS